MGKLYRSAIQILSKRIETCEQAARQNRGNRRSHAYWKMELAKAQYKIEVIQDRIKL